jgi:PAS domain S-box-containing protein
MEQSRFRQTLRRAFWIPFGIAIVLAATLILEVRFLIDRAASVEHTDQVITLSQSIYRNRVDQETGLRAYVLTGDRRFLDPFYLGRKRAAAMEPQLRQLVSDNPEESAANERAVEAFSAWSSWADQAIAMTKAGEDAGDVQFQLRGKALMDEYRRTRQHFIESEQQLRTERQARSRRAIEAVTTTIIAISILFALVFAFLGRKQLTNLSQSFAKALATARERGDWLHTTLTSIGDAVISTDADGRITLMNPVAEKLTEWTVQEAQGKPLADVFRIINQETRQTVENPVDKVRRLNRVVGLANHTVLISKNGKELAIDDSGAPIFAPDGSLTGVVLVFRDVSEQRVLAAESQSLAAETASQSERLAGIISSAMDAIITVDESQRIQVFNRAAEQIFGCPVAEAIGQPLDKFIPERFHHAHRQHIEGFGQTGVTNRSMSRPGDLLARRSDGQEFPIEATISQVEAGGESYLPSCCET